MNDDVGNHTSDAAIRALAEGLLDAIDGGRWSDADADLETLAEEALGCIVQERADGLATIARETARCHTALALRDGLGPEAMHRLGQLRAIGVLVNAGRRSRRPRPVEALTRAGTPTAAVLSALDKGPKSGQDLVETTGLSPETVARALPDLRASGLVRSWPAGRLVMNERTDRVQ